MNQTTIEKDLANKKIIVARKFKAPLEKVWKAWTEKELLDQWWAPRPWKAETKTMEFKEGGRWIYAMVGPDGNKQWCWADYQKIESNRLFIMTEGFGDENGKANQQMPSMKWTNIFTESNGVTNVEIEIEFSSEADLQKIIEMGFEEGFTAAHSNLDEMLQKNAVF